MVFFTGDQCGWLQIVTERVREVAVFTVSSGPSADYRAGAKPKGVAGGHESTNYAVLKAAEYPQGSRAVIRISKMKGYIWKIQNFLLSLFRQLQKYIM